MTAGRPPTRGFRKRVVYLDESVLGATLIGPSVDAPMIIDPAHLKLLGVPVLVFEAGGDALGSARRRAADRGVEVAIYTRGMFTTGHDADNRAVVRAVSGPDLDLVGLGLHAPRNVLDKIIKGARLHP